LATLKPSRRKLDALRKHGCFHSRPDVVDDDLFVTIDFFDPHDLLQIKYEMVRRVRVDGQPVSLAARRFGFSRPTVYQAICAFERGGLIALLPHKPGPRTAHKLNDQVVEFLQRILADNPRAQLSELVVALQERFGLSVHARSIERALKRREKKHR
jgi:transposase